METLTSRDGTRIAYDRSGSGPAVIFVDGALCSRASGPGTGLSGLMAPQFTTYAYDRRGRGDSGDTRPCEAAREVVDLEALIDRAGGSVCLFGHSSGAALALEAALKLGTKVRKLALYEPPYDADPATAANTRVYNRKLGELLAANRKGEAVELFMRSTGMPAEQIEAAKKAPFWARLESLAPSLAYDAAVLGEERSVPTARASSLETPALVMYGGAGQPFMRETAVALSRAMPKSRLLMLEGQTHNVDLKLLAPLLASFFGE